MTVIHRNTPSEKAEIQGLPLAERLVNELADAHIEAVAHGATLNIYASMVRRVAATLREFGIDPNQKSH